MYKRQAYALVSPSIPEVPLEEVVKRPVSEWKELMKNDFEPSVFKKYPEICKIKEELYANGALYASMSGSGSSVYAPVSYTHLTIFRITPTPKSINSIGQYVSAKLSSTPGKASG